MKQAISWILVASQLSWSTMVLNAQADQAKATISAEQQMLETVITIQGLKLSDKDAQQQVAGVLKRYEQNAPKDGRQERLAQAFVDMNIYTPAQAQAFVADAQASQKRLETANVSSADQATGVLSTEMKMLANLHPAGAQFSNCDVGAAIAVAGVVTAIVGLILRFDNPTCHGNGQYYPCDQTQCDQYGYCWTYTDWCEGTTCDQPGYYPHATAGDTLMIVGGVAAAVGAVIAFTGQEACQN